MKTTSSLISAEQPSSAPEPRLTSSNGHTSLQDADVELQRELGGGSQEGLDDGGAGKGCPVREQLPLRLPHLPLHLLRLTPAGHLLLPRDADIRLLHMAHAAVDAERLQTPAAHRWRVMGGPDYTCETSNNTVEPI